MQNTGGEQVMMLVSEEGCVSDPGVKCQDDMSNESHWGQGLDMDIVLRLPNQSADIKSDQIKTLHRNLLRGIINC